MWEEVSYNMWGRVKDRKRHLDLAIEFTGDHERYGLWMRKVIYQWPLTCEHNLTNKTINRKAWIGQAAAALAIQCPENIVREAWGHLTEQQRVDANTQAEKAIAMWETMNEQKITGDGCSDRIEDEDILDF